jgi:shikimate kinase
MNYFICGFMGAGKSTLLKELSNLEHGFSDLIDLDKYIYDKFGSKFTNLGDFIESIGFDQFRALEFSSLMQLIQKDNVLIALGGGSLSDHAIALLSESEGMWLNTPFEVCWSRIENDRARPLVKSGKLALEELYIERFEVYSNYKAVSSAQEVLESTCA